MIKKLIKLSKAQFFVLLCISFFYLVMISNTFSFQSRLYKISRAADEIKDDVSKDFVSNDNKVPELLGSETVDIDAKSSYAVDIKTGAVLYDKDSSKSVMPASTSKIITALVSLDTYDLDQKLTVFKNGIGGQKIGLKSGEMLTARDLLYALLVSSANDAAEVLSQNYPGGRDLFIAAMNIKAGNLGMKMSYFANPTGLDEDGQTTTAQDLVRASFYAMQNPVFKKIVGTKSYTILSDDGEVKYRLYNINQLLGTVEGVKGIKTGKTDGAMENLITYVERGNAKVIIAVLGSSDRFNETKRLINWIFSNYDFK